MIQDTLIISSITLGLVVLTLTLLLSVATWVRRAKGPRTHRELAMDITEWIMRHGSTEHAEAFRLELAEKVREDRVTNKFMN